MILWMQPRSLNLTSRLYLGWLDIVGLIMVRKAVFFRTIIVMEEYIPMHVVLMDKIRDFLNEGIIVNRFDSLITDFLNTCATSDLL